MTTPWPSTYEYALAHRCPTCKAPPGTDCDAPKKTARLAEQNRLRAVWDAAPITDKTNAQHAARLSAGIRHHWRDVGQAPLAEDREPGKRYDTLKETTS